MLTLAVGSLALGLQGAPPTFARDFYTGEQTNLILNQGHARTASNARFC